jgi:hypothetical protein
MATDRGTLDWLLDSDPALRWQVERDLAGAPPGVWQATRARVATEGFGATLLSKQDADGQWAGGAYFPGGTAFWETEEARAPGQPWTATTWTLKDLREWGVDASALAGTAEQLAANSRWEYDDLPYWGGEIDVCINSFTLATGAWLGVDVARLATWFRDHRLADGGWNCEAEEGRSTRSSFHSTLNALRGLLAYQQITGDTSLVDTRHGGEEYLLERRLLYRQTTGEPVGDFVREFVYPNRHQYSALAALDYFREASIVDGREPDPRMADAVQLVRDARQPDGTWLQGEPLAGRIWFAMDEAQQGEPSKWLTLIGTRVLEWWDGRGISTPIL